MIFEEIKRNYLIAINPLYTTLTRLDCGWVLYQSLSFLPLVIGTIIRFFDQIKHDEYKTDSKKPFPRTWVEYFIKINTCAYLLFYIPQTIARFTVGWDVDNIELIIHHFVTFYGAIWFLIVEYYPWFTIAPLAFHNLLLILPEYIKLYYTYIILIMMCYYGLTINPYNHRKGYKEIRYYVLMLSSVLLFMWATGFKNDIVFEMKDEGKY